MTIEIQFIEGKKEEILPIIKLTKSKNGKTGTATFVFISPKSIAGYTTKPISGMVLIANNKKILTTDVTIYFREGKPFLLKAILIFKNSKEWFEFLSFMNLYSKETGLSFSEKNSTP
jgi:photosystem II protein